MPEVLVPGTILMGRYSIAAVQKTGAGGNVYVVEDSQEAGTRKIVKEIYDLWEDPAVKERAFRWLEWMARQLAQVDHPALPKVHDLFSTDDRKFVVMDLVEGRPLEELLADRGGPLPELDVSQFGIQISEALKVLHDRGMVFGCLSPAHVLLAPDRRVHLIDFGLARYYERSWGESPSSERVEGYQAPEVRAAEATPDARADIYSLGAILHFLLTAHPPTAFASTSFPLVRGLNPVVSEGMELVVERALAPEPSGRYSEVMHLAEALARPQSVMPPEPVSYVEIPPPPPAAPRRKWPLLLFLIVIIAILALAVVFWPGKVPIAGKGTDPSPPARLDPAQAAANGVSSITPGEGVLLLGGYFNTLRTFDIRKSAVLVQVEAMAGKGRIANAVNSVVTDSGGKIWLASDLGIACHTGARAITVIDVQTTTDSRWKDQRILAVQSDGKGHLWSRQEESMAFYDGEGWEFFPLPGGGAVPVSTRNLALDPDGNIWAMTGKTQVSRYGGSGSKEFSTGLELNTGLLAGHPQWLVVAGGMNGKRAGRPGAVCALVRADYSGEEWSRIPLIEEGVILDLVLGQDDDVWVLTSDKLIHFNSQLTPDTTLPLPKGLGSRPLLALDGAGRPWLASNLGELYRFERNQWSSFILP